MDIIINNVAYTFVANYRQDDLLRASFNTLAEAVFDFNFESWYQLGYWTDSYVPYSLVHNGEVIANLSTNNMTFNYDGVLKSYLQIGTVMTHPNFRGKGLSRFLIEKILHQSGANHELIFLYANDTVLEFYTKFGFVPAKEYQYSRSISTTPDLTLIKQDMSDADSRDRLVLAIKSARPVSRLSMTGDVGLVMFYLSSFFSDYVYYIPALSSYLIAHIEGDSMQVLDLFSPVELQLESLLSRVVPKEIRTIRLGFTPFDSTGYTRSPFINDDTVLHVKGADSQLILDDKIMFPILAHT